MLIEQGTKLKYLLVGQRLSTMHVLAPPNTALQAVASVDPDAAATLELSPEYVKVVKQVLVQRDYERPFFITIPPLVEQPKQALKFTERVTVGADDATIVGDGLADITEVSALNQKLPFDLAADGKTLKVRGLVVNGVTSTARTVDCTLRTANSKTTIQLEVVTSKVESVAK